jgi:DnaK suppressor protein
MLENRRRELVTEVQGRIRDVRAEGNKERDVLDQGESSEVDIQEDIEFALIQMKSETLNKIDAALRRLEDGSYGDCFECGEEISEARLRALPFAVRCKDCEEARESAEQRERMLARRGGSSAFLFDSSSRLSASLILLSVSDFIWISANSISSWMSTSELSPWSSTSRSLLPSARTSRMRPCTSVTSSRRRFSSILRSSL